MKPFYLLTVCDGKYSLHGGHRVLLFYPPVSVYKQNLYLYIVYIFIILLLLNLYTVFLQKDKMTLI